MAEKDPETEKLELSLFRRKKKQPAPEADSSPPEKPSAQPEASSAAPASAAAPRTDAARPAPAPKPGRRKATKPVAAPAAAAPPPAAAATQATPPSPVSPATQVDTEPVPADVAPSEGSEESSGTKPRMPRVDIPLPVLAPPVAALVVGAVVGLAAVALTFASLLGCELVTGTDSCGGPGLLVLLAVVVLMILGGAAALRQMDVPDAGGLSFLGVAMFVAVCLVVLLPSLLEPWMIVVAPVLCALTFALAHWIVTRFDEDVMAEDGPEAHDVR